MPLKRLSLTLLSAVAAVSFTISSKALESSSRTEDSWSALTDEGSRESLFNDYVIKSYYQSSDYTSERSQPLAIPKGFTFPDDADFDRIENKDRSNSLFCVDISHYTDKSIDLSTLSLQSIRCVYAKATQGTAFKDDHFGSFWPALKNIGALSRGAYMFLSAGSPGKDQADAFVDYVSLHGGFETSDLPPAIDLEWDVSAGHPKDKWIGHPSSEILKSLIACAERIKERTGRTPIIYTAKSWWSSSTIPLSKFDALNGYQIWIADYNPKRKLKEQPAVPGGVTPLIWQYTDRALLTTGYTRGLDASIFYGTESDFIQKFGIKK